MVVVVRRAVMQMMQIIWPLDYRVVLYAALGSQTLGVTVEVARSFRWLWRTWQEQLDHQTIEIPQAIIVRPIPGVDPEAMTPTRKVT